MVRPETRDWLTLKEGYLIKTKWAKGIHKSSKLRWFVLKQHPATGSAELEYFEGMSFKGSAPLAGARIVPQVPSSCMFIKLSLLGVIEPAEFVHRVHPRPGVSARDRAQQR